MEGISVLVIEDDGELRGVLENLLASAGYDVRTAEDGVQGMDMFFERAPDLVVTDLFMPRSDGIEVVREIKRRNPDVRVLAMTGMDTDVDYLAATTHLGAWHTLRKPFRGNAFLAAIEEVMGMEGPAEPEPLQHKPAGS
ncbi:MAG: response regulator [Alphaproteobacteria bacterium]|jgi:DNA-binding response OmpR family regulator|nr:response regulator [Alphaproteobacteria bacterium]|tara:strand:- start:210 stop:626 length:417 start_codon:yes stop_codon:yes gene_type:complete